MSSINKAQWTALIKDTILKELRSKTLIFIFAATTLMIILGHVLLRTFIAGNEGNPLAVDASKSLSLMFIMINAWSVIISAIFGISSIRSDFKDNIIYQYLAFPISRTQYMFSRIFGTWILVFGYYLYSYLLSAILFSFASGSIVVHGGHLLSILLMGVYILLIIFLSFIFSMMAGKIGAFLLVLSTISLISISTSAMRILEFKDYFTDFGFFKGLELFIYFLLPRVNYIAEVASNMLSNEKVNLNMGLETLHLVATSALYIFIADRFIKRKNF